MSEISLNPSFAINDFDKPKVMTNMESYVNDIMMVLFGKPGFFPSIPSLGMDIQQYLYKFEDEVSADDIKIKLSKQCEEFSDTIDTGNLDVVTTVYKDNIMIIFILPVIDDNKQKQLSLGITTNENGELIYNFVENDIQQI